MKRVLVLLCCLVGLIKGHLLPQALEDVHTFVQSELQSRSQDGQLGIEAPPSGGPMFQTTQTQTYIGVPVVLQKEMKLDEQGRFQKSFSEDLKTAQSQNIAAAAQQQQRQVQQSGEGLLPRGLLPPSPLEQQQSSSASNEQPQVIPADLVGPSTFVSDAPRNNINSNRQVRIPPQIVNQQGGQQDEQGRTMEGWVPLDNEGTKLAKGVGVKLEVTEDDNENRQDPAYRDTGYSIKQQQDDEDSSNDRVREARQQMEIIPTNSVKLSDIIIDKTEGTLNLREGGGKGRFPVYPGGRTPKVVIHAQNVIIRDGSETEINSNNDTISPNNIKQFPAYSGVPQLNNFLRDQLRFAAMNQLVQNQLHRHPLNNKPFPRPLSLRQIALAVRTGQFPEPPLQDPLLGQASQMQINIPHMVKMNPDALPSIQSQTKLPYPGGLGLRNLYRNILQQQGGPPAGPGFDPREPLEYSLLAALSGQRQKVPGVPKFKAHHHTLPDYGGSVAYTTGDKEPIQIVDAEPTQPAINHLQQGGGNLRDVSEQLLKQMILQELQEIQDTPNVLLPHGGQQNPARLPLRHSLARPTPYGTNAHPFAYLGENSGAGGVPDAVFEETYEYSLPPGMSVEDYMKDDGSLYGSLRKRPTHQHHQRYPPSGYLGEAGGVEDGPVPDADGALPINKDTILQLGKGLFHQALDFSRNHNPMTLFSKLRSLPPVKVEMYKVPMGIPESMMEQLPEKWRSGGGGSRSSGGGRSRNSRGGKGDKQGRRKNQPRKNGSRHRSRN